MRIKIWQLKMKSRLLIIIGIVLIVAITSAFILNYYIDEEIKVQKLSDEQIDIIFKRCDYQENEKNEERCTFCNKLRNYDNVGGFLP